MKRILLAAFASLALAASVGAQTINQTFQVQAATLKTATSVTSADQTNAQWKGAHIIIRASTYTTGAYTPTVQGKDPVSGEYYSLLVGTAISSTSTNVLKIAPGITAATNASVADLLPKTWRVVMTGTTTPVSMIYSIGGVLE